MTLRDRIRAATERSDWRTALRLAATIAHDLGSAGPIITRAHEAIWHPDFGRQLGHDPTKSISNGIDALKHLLEIDMAKKLKPADKQSAGPPAKKTKAVKPTAQASDKLILTTADLAAFTTLGDGKWEGEKDGATINIERNKNTGGFSATVTKDKLVFTGTGKGYASAARSAAATFNRRTAK